MRAWHWRNWGALGWVESALKAAAFVAVIAAVVVRDGSWGVQGGWGGVALGLLVVATLGLVAAVADRVAERELFALSFVIVNVVAHVCAVALAVTEPLATTPLTVFCVLMLAGELVKLAFLGTTGFRVRDVSPKVVVGLTGFYAVLYLTIAIAVSAA